MNSEQITAFLQEHWYIASVLIGAVILIGAIRNWNWLCDPTGTRDAHRHNRDIAEKTARECYPEIRDFTYDILWNDLPREVQGQLMNEDETL